MSTHSTIAVQNPDGSVNVIYCHYDGYLKGVGTCLVLEHDSYRQALELVLGGPLDSCFPGKPIERFDGVNDNGTCLDGETLRRVFPTFEAYLIGVNRWIYCHYHYIFRDDHWHVVTDEGLVKVEKALWP